MLVDPRVPVSKRIALLLVFALGAVTGAMPLARAMPPVAVEPSATSSVARYNVYELTFAQSATYANPWEDVRVAVTFTSPSNTKTTIGGFYYDLNTWKARFAPGEVGAWSWVATFTAKGASTSRSGTFRCVAGSSPGFVRASQTNPYRMLLSDGSPYYPLGINDCVMDWDGSGSPFDDDLGLDGGFRTGHGEGGRYVDLETYLAAYGRQGAGFNLFRWTANGCAFKLWDTVDPVGNRYLVREGQWGDRLVRNLRAAGFRIMLGFAAEPFFPRDSGDAGKMAAVQRYFKYVMDRYGAYVDIYELMNESVVDESWYAQNSAFVHANDPYGHPLSTSWERPDLPGIDVNSPHWYQKENELESDHVTFARIRDAKAAGPNKLVIFGEQGNTVQNWDQRSGVRMRIRAWTAFFNEGTLTFWNSSFAKDYKNDSAANVYIGPEERGYMRAYQKFVAKVGADVAMTTLDVSDPLNVRAYGLASSKMILGYFQHAGTHDEAEQGLKVTVNAPATGMKGVWVDPATGKTRASIGKIRGNTILTAPSFTIDLALKLTTF